MSTFEKKKTDVFDQEEGRLQFDAFLKMFETKAALDAYIEGLETSFKAKYPTFRFAHQYVYDTDVTWD